MADGRRGMPAVLELLGRRWALRIVWELRRDSLTFSQLRERLAISPSVLSTRLSELARAGITDRDGTRRYLLSGHGRELARLLYELNRWAGDADRAGGGGVSSQRELA